MTNSNKSVFIDRNTSHIKHGWQEKRMIMEYNACVSCALIGHNFPTVLQVPSNIHSLQEYQLISPITTGWSSFPQFSLVVTKGICQITRVKCIKRIAHKSRVLSVSNV